MDADTLTDGELSVIGSHMLDRGWTSLFVPDANPHYLWTAPTGELFHGLPGKPEGVPPPDAVRHLWANL